MHKLVTLGLVERLENCDFILETKMAELNENKNSNNQIDQMLCENFILPWKYMNSTFNTCLHVFFRIVVLKVQENFIERYQVKLFSSICLYKINLRSLWNHTILSNFQELSITFK